MGLLDDMKGLLTQYTSGAAPAGDAGEHFQQVAQSVDSGTLAQGIAAAMRSDQTPPFAQMVSQLFSSGSTDQKTSMLNTLLSAVESRAAGAPRVAHSRSRFRLVPDHRPGRGDIAWHHPVARPACGAARFG